MQVILNADDLGYSPGVNQAIMDLFAQERLTSASLLVTMPFTQPAIEMALAHILPVGVHLDLSKGRPILPPERIPALVKTDGTFYSSPILFARVLSGIEPLSQIATELRAQIEYALNAGINPTHLDTQAHWQAIPYLHRLVRRLAVEYSVPRIRTGNVLRALAPSRLWLAFPHHPCRHSQYPSESDYLLSLHQWLLGPGEFHPVWKSSRLHTILSNPKGVLEIVTHPCKLPDPSFPPDSLNAQRRSWEYEFLLGNSFPNWMHIKA